jgi:hypothetical protein
VRPADEGDADGQLALLAAAEGCGASVALLLQIHVLEHLLSRLGAFVTADALHSREIVQVLVAGKVVPKDVVLWAHADVTTRRGGFGDDGLVVDEAVALAHG